MGLVKTHKQRRQHNDYLQDSHDLEGNHKAVYVHYIEKMQHQNDCGHDGVDGHEKALSLVGNIRMSCVEKDTGGVGHEIQGRIFNYAKEFILRAKEAENIVVGEGVQAKKHGHR